VLVDGRQRRKAEALSDFLEAGRVAVALNELVQVVEDFALALGQRHHGAAIIRKQKAKVKPRVC
jgi:hypothetical protein